MYVLQCEDGKKRMDQGCNTKNVSYEMWFGMYEDKDRYDTEKRGGEPVIKGDREKEKHGRKVGRKKLGEKKYKQAGAELCQSQLS